MVSSVRKATGAGKTEESDPEREKRPDAILPAFPPTTIQKTSFGSFLLLMTTWIACHIPSLKNKMIFTENNNSGVGRILRMSGVATAKRFGPDSKIIDEMLDSLVKSGNMLPSATTNVCEGF
ncbi:hypothetical protein SS1G_02569 [Sclerotinia sclerotiorum 1980 UF-70]|uniref:Uncharacterized protein n=1 Tax=Sclerotinia sclerotiorum (strain ATCC 18683 / 1980 / Ss-1) TaxID=665079 RepID=A7EB83_SCLS1|nr:hypothetical protein SS1G_02569 [Sclerotinia sclerotiorum 1980 UF-70]EDN99711.1 hypothetical protein SS1G_02569 [Sclerotinia sclerotiorum 1980 UF-70]